MPSSATDGGSRAWLALAGVLALGAVVVAVLPAGAAEALEWRPERAAHEPWRALGAALVHYSTLHLLANLAGAALVAALGVTARVPHAIAAAWLVAWPLTQLALLARPELLRYGGLSGVLHAGVACVGVELALHARGRRRAIGALVLAGLVLKVVGEAPWGTALRHPAGWDIATAPFAHASGLVAGAAAALVCGALARGVAKRP